MSHPKAANHSLAWLLCAHDSLYKLLMFGAFFDDSGTHPYAKIGALAGYVADEAEWKRFEDSWGEFLADAGIQFFHARDCVRGEKAFSGWTEAERLAYYWRAIDVIRAHHLMGVSIAGRTVDFTPERIEQARTIPSAATGPFELSAQFTFMALGQCFSKKWPGERVTIVCENGKREDNERVTRAYFDLIDAPAHAYMADLFYAQPAFFPKPHHYGLQAADVLAYEVGQEMVARLASPVMRPRKEWDALWEHAEGNGGLVRVSVPIDKATR